MKSCTSIVLLDIRICQSPQRYTIDRTSLRFLVEHIISLNVFGCLLSFRENHLKDAEAKKDQYNSY
jgi:hypothetical protein